MLDSTLYGLKQTTAPTVEPVVAADVITASRAAGSDESTQITAWLLAARELVETYCGLQLITATWTYKLDEFPAWEIWLPRGPNWAIASVAYLDTAGASQTVSASDYRLDSYTGRLTPAYGDSWPSTYQVTAAVTITYTSGYGSTAASVPGRFKEAIKAIVIDWMENRRMTFDLPPAVKRLLDSLWDGRL